MKTVLVTGGTGFLGRHLCQRLEKAGVNNLDILNSMNCDLRSANNLLQFRDRKYDIIFHLAVWTKAGPFCLHHAGEQWIYNQLINTNVLSFWHRHQPQATMIAMGTSCAYPDGDELLVECEYMSGEPSSDLYTYAMTKRMLFEGLRSLSKQFGLRYQYLIPSTLYGPNFDIQDSHFIFDLIKKIYFSKFNESVPILWGDGTQERELTYVDDAIDLMLHFAKFPSNDILNLGGENAMSIRKYAELISEQFSFDPDKIFYDVNAEYIGTKRRSLSTQKLRSIHTNYAPTPLVVGLLKTIEYYQRVVDER